MSVYTQVNQTQLVDFISAYDVGELVKYEGILAGVENTNFFVDTDKGRYVLTLFEQLDAQELPYFLDVMAYFSHHDIPSADPVADKNGQYLRELNGKPAALVHRLEGKSVEYPNAAQCASLATNLAKMHQVSPDFHDFRRHERGLDWFQQTAAQVMPKLDDVEKGLLETELAYQAQQDLSHLPVGVIHADLFRDNALFQADTLHGIIDFYYACNHYLLYDVAVTVNDWCIDEGQVNTNRLQAFLDHYQQVHPFDAAEKQAWPVLLRRAALRFWLSRLADMHFPRGNGDALTNIKDPKVFQTILERHISHPPTL